MPKSPNVTEPIQPLSSFSEKSHEQNNPRISISPITNFTSDASVSSKQRSTLLTLEEDATFVLGVTHSKSLTIASRICSNYPEISFYSSVNVFSSELDDAILLHNEKVTKKFFFGVDVVYQKTRNNYMCLPLFCPAKIFGSNSSNIEVYVGISFDGAGAYPVMAIYDSHGTFKNIVKSRYAIHTSFKQIEPISISHNFSETEMKEFEDALKAFLKIKCKSDHLEGISHHVLQTTFILI